MAKLLFLLDGNSLGEFALDQERITIGRRPSNQIHIDNLAVSGEHAVIVTIGNDSFLEDLNSTNGTTVNGETIKKYVLQHDDVIEFGKYQLRYINPSQSAATYHDGFEKTMMLAPVKPSKPAKNNAAVEKLLPEKDSYQEVLTEQELLVQKAHPQAKAQVQVQPDSGIQTAEKSDTEQAANDLATNDQGSADNPVTQPKVEPVIAARLQVLNGTSAGRELTLNKTMTTLGKPGSQVAVINKRPSGYFITHVGGNNLPIVNGQEIGVQAHALNNRDVIELAGTKMEFVLNEYRVEYINKKA